MYIFKFNFYYYIIIVWLRNFIVIKENDYVVLWFCLYDYYEFRFKM